MQQVKRQDIATSRPARRRRWLTRDRLTALLMITPSVIAIAVFVYGFIGWTGFVSLTKWESITPDYTFVGFKNYTDIFNSGRFQTDVRNTIVFTTFFLVGCLGLGLLLAVLVLWIQPASTCCSTVLVWTSCRAIGSPITMSCRGGIPTGRGRSWASRSR